MSKTGRNDPCPCGSELKYKHCHGDITKKEICYAAANETAKKTMLDLIEKEKQKKTKNKYDDLTKGTKNDK